MVHDKVNGAELAAMRAKAVRRLTRSAPVFAAPHNIGEREPPVMTDSAGADAAVGSSGKQP